MVTRIIAADRTSWVVTAPPVIRRARAPPSLPLIQGSCSLRNPDVLAVVQRV
jgi:hypothetical protein